MPRYVIGMMSLIWKHIGLCMRAVVFSILVIKCLQTS
jgi:hypothetical protein